MLNKLITEVLNPFIGFLFVLAIVVFLYGIIELLAGADNEEKRTTGKKHLMWGVVGLFIMVSVYAIIQVIKNSLLSFS